MPIFILLFNIVSHVHGSIHYLVLRKLWRQRGAYNKNILNGIGDEGADGAMLPHQIFWARTAPDCDVIASQ